MDIEPTIRIGKNGLTEGTITEIKKQLKKRKIIKIKLLRSFAEREEKDESARKIAELTNSMILERKGFVVTLKSKYAEGG